MFFFHLTSKSNRISCSQMIGRIQFSKFSVKKKRASERSFGKFNRLFIDRMFAMAFPLARNSRVLPESACYYKYTSWTDIPLYFLLSIVWRRRESGINHRKLFIDIIGYSHWRRIGAYHFKVYPRLAPAGVFPLYQHDNYDIVINIVYNI